MWAPGGGPHTCLTYLGPEEYCSGETCIQKAKYIWKGADLCHFPTWDASRRTFVSAGAPIHMPLLGAFLFSTDCWIPFLGQQSLPKEPCVGMAAGYKIPKWGPQNKLQQLRILQNVNGLSPRDLMLVTSQSTTSLLTHQMDFSSGPWLHMVEGSMLAALTTSPSLETGAWTHPST